MTKKNKQNNNKMWVVITILLIFTGARFINFLGQSTRENHSYSTIDSTTPPTEYTSTEHDFAISMRGSVQVERTSTTTTDGYNIGIVSYSNPDSTEGVIVTVLPSAISSDVNPLLEQSIRSASSTYGEVVSIESTELIGHIAKIAELRSSDGNTVYMEALAGLGKIYLIAVEGDRAEFNRVVSSFRLIEQ